MSTLRPFSYGTTARYKLGLKLPSDRSAAAKLLNEARAFNRRCAWKRPSVRENLEIAAAFALQEAEMADDDRQFRIFDHVAYVMEYVAGVKDLMPAD